MRKPLRFRHFLTLAAIAACSLAEAQNVGINTNGAAPDPAAILDIDVGALSGTSAQPKRGLFVPRMTEADRLAIPVGAADDGLLVYQTDLGTPADSTSGRGFWYYDAAPAAWLQLSVVRRGWTLRGNAVSNTGVPQYLGTVGPSMNHNLVFRTVLAPADPAMQMGYALFDYQSGYVGLGTPAPATERLEVNGAIHFAKNQVTAAHLTTPVEGTIRYGTENGVTSATGNYHWGTSDTLGNVYWSRLENAEDLVTPPTTYPKDTLQCTGDDGDALRGHLSATPVTNTTNTPANVYSPFATNFNQNAEGSYRVQYLYRYQELVDAGLCYDPLVGPSGATIKAVAFFCLDQENITNPLGPTKITGDLRGGASTNTYLQGTSAYFGANNTTPYMDDGIRTKPVNGSFLNLTPGPGWITFTLSTPIYLSVGDNLIIDIVWTRNNVEGLGPRVELENPGFNCTKWAIKTNAGIPLNQLVNMDDNILGPSGTSVSPTNINPHNLRPVTRFTGTVVSQDVIAGKANYIHYDGGMVVGTAPFKGPGTVSVENGVYDSNVLLSDHVFDRYFDGAARPEDAEAGVGYAYVGLSKLRERLERERHLPNMPSRSEWEARGGAPLGAITTGLWRSVENQALYISQLEKDLSSLEEMTFGTDLSPQEIQRLIAEVESSKRLSDAQKLHLIDALNEKAQPGTPKP